MIFADPDHQAEEGRRLIQRLVTLHANGDSVFPELFKVEDLGVLVMGTAASVAMLHGLLALLYPDDSERAAFLACWFNKMEAMP